MTGSWKHRPAPPGWPIVGLSLALLLLVTGSGPVSAGAAAGPEPAAGPGSTAGPGPAAGLGSTAGPGSAAGPGTAGAPGPARSPSGRYRWPLDGVPRPVRRFDPPPRPWLPGHRGVDLAAGPAAEVRAAGAGTVAFAGPVAGRPVVSVSHPGGLRTTYEPVRPVVTIGDRVAAGDLLGVLLPGHPGCPVENCLHWGLRRDAEYLDPLALLGLGRIRLLPWREPPAWRNGARVSQGGAGGKSPAGAEAGRSVAEGPASAVGARPVGRGVRAVASAPSGRRGEQRR